MNHKVIVLSILTMTILTGCGLDDLNNAPSLSSISNQSVDVNNAVTVALAGTDADGNDITYSASTTESNIALALSSVTNSGATLTLTPVTDWSGTGTIIAKATDGVDSSTTSFTLTIIGGLNTPSNVEVIQDDSATANLAAVNYAAYNSAGTDYTAAKAETWLDTGNWLAPLNMADMLMCIMQGTGATKLPNSTYLGLVDMSQCANERAGSQQGKQTSFMKAVVVSSRADNSSNQIVTVYFVNQSDNNSDGDTADTGETTNYLTETIVESAVSSSNPWGVFNFNWKMTNPPVAGDYDMGTLDISTTAAGLIDLKFVSSQKDQTGRGQGAYEFDEWAAGLLNPDGSSGTMTVFQDSTQTQSGLDITYLISFNATHANVNDGSSATCYNLDESTMTPYVYSYNLYDSTTGALKDISAGMEIVYGSSKENRGHIGQYTDGNGDRKDWMWAEDGTNPTTIYSRADDTVSYTVSWSSGQPTITGPTFDDPIRFEASFTDADGTTRTDNLNYEGPGQLWGIEWTEGASTWSPAYNLADGTELTDTNGTVWIVKQMGLWKTLADATGSCGDIPVTSSDVSFTKPTIGTVTGSWDNIPTITADAAVIHGIVQ